MENLNSKTKNLKTFEDACQVLGIDPEKVIPDFSGYPKSDQVAMAAHAKLVIISKAANKLENDDQEWIPDWSDGSWKYYPWFIMDEGSSGFRYYDCGRWATISLVGSRLCFKSKELAEYIGKQFLELYKDYFMN